MKNVNSMAVMIVGLLLVAGFSFYGGMQYGQSKNTSGGRGTGGGAGFQQFGGMGGGRNARGGNGGGLVIGKILSKDATSITVELRDGGSKIIFLSDTTQISKMAAGTSKDMEVGTQITAQGSQNPDGSVSAQSVQIRPVSPSLPSNK